MQFVIDYFVSTMIFIDFSMNCCSQTLEFNGNFVIQIHFNEFVNEVSKNQHQKKWVDDSYTLLIISFCSRSSSIGGGNTQTADAFLYKQRTNE